MKKKFVFAIGFVAMFPFVYSCGNGDNSSDSYTTDTTVVSDTVIADVDSQVEDAGNYISYFNNGEYVFVKVYSNKRKVSLFDADKKMLSSGTLSEESNGVLTYAMDNESIVKIFVNDPNMTMKTGDEEKKFVLISPNQETYVSSDKKDSIKAIYYPQESVTLITKQGTLVLKPITSHAKGAEYVGVEDSTMTWTTQMNNATLKKDGKQVKYTTDGKSKLPETYLK